MALITVVCGAVLIGIGVVGYEVTDRVSWTALIPAMIGAVLAVLGGLSFKDHLRKHTMHAAALIGSLTFAYTAVVGWPQLPIVWGLVSGHASKARVYSHSATAAVCLVFVGLCVNSFVQARRRREKLAASQAEAPANP
jgi:hypothetical protein